MRSSTLTTSHCQGIKDQPMNCQKFRGIRSCTDTSKNFKVNLKMKERVFLKTRIKIKLLFPQPWIKCFILAKNKFN